jgi:hypothetical protein
MAIGDQGVRDRGSRIVRGTKIPSEGKKLVASDLTKKECDYIPNIHANCLVFLSHNCLVFYACELAVLL